MPNVILTVLVSAITSGIITLALEALLKPRLDARREIVGAAHRHRREFSEHLVTIAVACGKWTNYRKPPGLTRDASSRLREEMNRDANAVDEATRHMSDNAANIALGYATSRIRELVGRYIATARGIELSDRPFQEKAELLGQITGPAHDWLFARRWRVVTVVKAHMELMRLLDDIAPLEPPS